MKLLLIDCTGLGIEYGDKQERISGEVHFVETDAEIIHLQDDNGIILCTLLSSPEEYEQRVNYDRRLQNSRNGFTVEYDSTGAWCCVKRAVKPKRMGCLWRWLLVAVATALIVIASLIVTGAVAGDDDTTPQDTVVTETTETTETTDSTSTVTPTTEEVPQVHKNTAAEQNRQVQAQAVVAKEEPAVAKQELLATANSNMKRLHSMSCTLRDVLEVEKWWRGLSKEEQLWVNKKYDFDRGLNAYNNVFYADSAHELLRISEKYRSYFSKEQQRTLEGVARDEAIFRQMRHKLKKWSFEDLRRYVGMIGLMN